MSPVETNQAEARGTLECPLPIGIHQLVSWQISDVTTIHCSITCFPLHRFQGRASPAFLNLGAFLIWFKSAHVLIWSPCALTYGGALSLSGINRLFISLCCIGGTRQLVPFPCPLKWQSPSIFSLESSPAAEIVSLGTGHTPLFLTRRRNESRAKPGPNTDAVSLSVCLFLNSTVCIKVTF